MNREEKEKFFEQYYELGNEDRVIYIHKISDFIQQSIVVYAKLKLMDDEDCDFYQCVRIIDGKIVEVPKKQPTVGSVLGSYFELCQQLPPTREEFERLKRQVESLYITYQQDHSWLIDRLNKIHEATR